MTTLEEQAQEKAGVFSSAERLTDQELRAKVGATFTLFVAEFESLSQAEAARKPAPEQWSAREVGDHIALSTGAVANVIRVLAQGKRVRDADWDPPSRLRGDSGEVDGIRDRIRALPTEVGKLFDDCLETDRMDVTTANSHFGELNWREWYYFLRVHAHDHLEQIKKLR